MSQQTPLLQQVIDKFEKGEYKFNQELINNTEKMLELKFFDADEYWLYNRYFTTSEGLEFSFDFEIYKNNPVDNFRLCILDEDCLQPYEYWRYLRVTDPRYSLIEDEIKNHIKHLLEIGVIQEIKR